MGYGADRLLHFVLRQQLGLVLQDVGMSSSSTHPHLQRKSFIGSVYGGLLSSFLCFQNAGLDAKKGLRDFRFLFLSQDGLVFFEKTAGCDRNGLNLQNS